MPPQRVGATDDAASWLPFGLGDLFCVHDRRTARPEVPPPLRSRPLDGLSFVLPIALPHEPRSMLRVLGGRIVGAVDGATFCVVPQGLQEAHLSRDPYLLSALDRCRSTGVGVVEASWVSEVSNVREGEDWTSVSVDPHIPPVMALLDDFTSSSGSAAGGSSREAPALSTAVAAASAEAIRSAAESASPPQRTCWGCTGRATWAPRRS